MKAFELIKKYNNGERDFSFAHLRGAELTEANLVGANLSNADLTDADLYEANLSNADLTGATLWETGLNYANLSGANLTGADLREACINRANLSGANLTGADLSSADLIDTDFTGANLTGTCLDPRNHIKKISNEALAAAGFEVDGDFVIGYRTEFSMNAGCTKYIPGKVYTAPYFSTDTSTECHPGLYFAPLAFFEKWYKFCRHVRVAAVNGEIVHARGKWRAKRLMVLPLEGE
jgi:hypothetical protein